MDSFHCIYICKTVQCNMFDLFCLEYLLLTTEGLMLFMFMSLKAII